MSSITGKNLKMSIFGESHGEAIGVVLDGLLPGMELDIDHISAQMKRRAPGKNLPWSTSRSEPDIPRILSGVYKGRTTGTPLCAIIENMDRKSQDYPDEILIPRPGHADYTGHLRYSGAEDPRGGGHFSGRLTAPMVFAGSICMQIIRDMLGAEVFSHILSIGDEKDILFSGQMQAGDIDFPVIDERSGERMKRIIEAAAKEGDSVGGVIETVFTGIPAGLGDPIFEGMESILASSIFAVPAVKGVEFGSGFSGSALRGSENNDQPYYTDGGNGRKAGFRTNNSGGIMGGITNGMPLIIRTAIKPTPSIAKEQMSINMRTQGNVPLTIKGRHDPCIVPRAVPVIESVCAHAILDIAMGAGLIRRRYEE